MNYLDWIVSSQKKNHAVGIPSICSANPQVLSAVLNDGLAKEKRVLIESTCNQVNQFGGYTGMKPVDFMAYLHDLASQLGFPAERLIIGGDHLGPNVWKGEPASQAMDKSRKLVNDYVEAGYQKIHIDTSMSCLDDEHGLDPAVIADRTADLIAVSEAAFSKTGQNENPIRYIVGSEVPHPGGMAQGEDPVAPSNPGIIDETIRLTRKALEKHGCASTWERIIAIVVQPGVEFDMDHIIDYDAELARGLSDFIEKYDGLVFEAHSTDYQTREALKKLVEDHFAILKVGPALTFAFREAVYALAMIEKELAPFSSDRQASYIIEVLEAAMLKDPEYWRGYYSTSEKVKLARHYSLSDRIRYYWTKDAVKESLDNLLANFQGVEIPLSLLSQFLPVQFRRIRSGELQNKVEEIVQDKIVDVIADYDYACLE